MPFQPTPVSIHQTERSHQPRLSSVLTFSFFLFTFYLSAQPVFPIKKSNKWGLMNAEGRIVLTPEYDAIGEFKQFGYAVMQKKGKVGMLNAKGEELLPPRYDDLKALDSTLISVNEGGSWKVITLEGKVILPPGYERAEVLSTRPPAHDFNRGESAIGGRRQSGGSSTTTTVLPTPEIRNPKSEIPPPSFLAYMRGGQWGVVDAQGRQVTAPRFDEISVMKKLPEGVQGTFFKTKKDKLLGLMLQNGFEPLPPQAEEIRVFNANLIFFKKYRKWGAVDCTGREVLKAGYDHFSRVSDQFIKVGAEGKTFLFSLAYNSLITNGEYEAYYPFSSEYVLVKKQRLLGLIDHCGELVLPVKYNEIQPYDGDVFRANLDGSWGIVTLYDRQVIPFRFDYIAPMKDGLCIVIENRRFGIANALGEVVVQPEFDRIELENREAKAFSKGVPSDRREKFTRYNFDEVGRITEESSFNKHFTIKVTGDNERFPTLRSADDNPFLTDKFEWFYAPKKDMWGLRRLDNGKVQIEPSFHQVQVERALGLTLVAVEMKQELDFDRTGFRFDMAYGIVKNDTGLLVHEVNLLDVRLADFDAGLPVARCIFTDGRQGLVNRIGKIVKKDFAFIGEFRNGVARASLKGKTSSSPDSKGNHLGNLRAYLDAQLAPVFLADYTQYDYDLEKSGVLTCDGCTWGYVDTAGNMAVQPQFSFAKDFVNEVGIVEQDKKWGMVDASGKQLLPCEYDELGFLENTGNTVLRIFKKEEKYGLIDTLGNLTVSVRYDEIGSFSEGRLAVKRNGVWGFVDRNGREVVPCRFDEVSPFSEGWAAARLGSKWGYVDKNGNTALAFNFSKAGNFNNGMAFAKNEAPHYGYIDKSGQWVIEPRFPKAEDFNLGLARVSELDGDAWRWGLINPTGNFVVKPKFVSIGAFNEHGLAVIGVGGNPVKFALINTEGDIVTALPFREIAPFSEGLARAKYRDGFGFLNTKGKLVIPADFSKTSHFSEGKAAVWLDGQCGFIDTTGNFIVEPQFSRCLDFREDRAIVFKGSNRAGLIDPAGNFIIEPGINKLIDFAEGRGLVRDTSCRFFYITEKSGFYDGYYLKAGEFRHGVAVVQVEGRWAIINQQGIEIIPPKYDKIEEFENGFAKVRIQGFNGLTNLQGELIIQPDYEYISYAGEGLFRVEQGDKIGYFDMGGKWVWGLQE